MFFYVGSFLVRRSKDKLVLSLRRLNEEEFYNYKLLFFLIKIFMIVYWCIQFLKNNEFQAIKIKLNYSILTSKVK